LGNAGIGKLIFSIVVGILIGVASVLVIFVVHKYTKEFFRETEEQAREFGEG
jgi:type IV secretory pathway VirB6-like protein